MLNGFSLSPSGLLIAGGGPGNAPVNLLPSSHEFGGTYWGGVLGSVTQLPGQSDPFGGNKATLFTSLGAASAWVQKASVSMTPAALGIAQDQKACFSQYFELGAGGTFSGGELRLYNGTIGQPAGGMCSQKYSVSSDVFSSAGNSGDGTTGGIISIGSGWYRIYLVVDYPENQISEGWKSTDAWSPRTMLWNGDDVVGRELYIAHAQLEPGDYPGAPLEKSE